MIISRNNISLHLPRSLLVRLKEHFGKEPLIDSPRDLDRGKDLEGWTVSKVRRYN